MSGTGVDQLLLETIDNLLADHCAPEQVGAAEGGIDTKLWEALAGSGLLAVGVAEAAGGSGGDLRDAAAIAKAAGRYAAPVPLTETSIIGGWVCEHSGLSLPDGPMAVVVSDQVAGRVRRVPWASVAAHLLVVIPEGVALVDPATVGLEPGHNYAGEPRADVTLNQPIDVVPGPSPAAARTRGALARALLMAGALGQAVDLSVQYANEREQFGRPIGKFQILQHYLAEMAGESAAAEAAADTAVDVISSGADADEVVLAVAAAKAVAGRAAAIINRLAHQLHGAIGYTDEHRLQYSTRRLWSWRDEYGTEAEWAARLGGELCRRGEADLWPTLTRWPPAATA